MEHDGSPAAAAERDLPAGDDRPHPADGAVRPVRDPRAGGQAPGADVRRPDLPDRVGLALPAGGLPGALRHQHRAGHPVRREAARARHPDHDRRDELRRALRARQGRARPGRDGGRHLDHHRRRRDDAGGAEVLEVPGLPVPAVALRVQPGRPDAGGRDRDRDRAGRQAGRRRDAARPEDQRAGGRDAHPAGRDRPALVQPAPGLDRPGRPGDQDGRAARDHRLAEADLHQARRHPGDQRRQAGGRGRGGRGGGRRHAGRHRRHAGRLHRARRHPDPAGGPHGGRGAARRRQDRTRCS